MSVRIRPYRRSDLGFLHRSLLEYQEYHVRIDPWKLGVRVSGSGKRYASAMFRRYERKHGFVLVAELNGVPAGFVAGWVDRYSGLERMVQRPNRRGNISELAVLKEFRRRGVGSQLLRKAEERLEQEGCDHIMLDVAYSNLGARRLYAKSGYAPRGFSLVKPKGQPLTTWAEIARTGRSAKPRRPSRRPATLD